MWPDPEGEESCCGIAQSARNLQSGKLADSKRQKRVAVVFDNHRAKRQAKYAADLAARRAAEAIKTLSDDEPVTSAAQPVMIDRDTGRSRGFGFVTFEDPGSVNAAITMPTQELDGRTVTVKKATRDGSGRPGGGAAPEGVEFNVVKVFKGFETNFEKPGYFEKYGTIEDAVVMMDPGTQRSRGFGFVTFKDSSSVEACMTNYSSNEIDGKWIEVKRCIPQDKMAPGQGKGKGKGKAPSYNNGAPQGGYPPPGYGYGGYPPPAGPPGYGGYGPPAGPYGYQGYGYPPAYGGGGYGAPGCGGYGAYPPPSGMASRSAPY
eukprot:Skav216608  [mRNA]  locus=scaffold2940:18217:33070:+ [translate_table: standard]